MGRKQFSQRPRSSPGVNAPAAHPESSSRQADRPPAPAGGPISSADSAAVPVGPPSCSTDRPAVGSTSLGPAEPLPVRRFYGLPPGYDNMATVTGLVRPTPREIRVPRRKLLKTERKMEISGPPGPPGGPSTASSGPPGPPGGPPSPISGPPWVVGLVSRPPGGRSPFYFGISGPPGPPGAPSSQISGPPPTVGPVSRPPAGTSPEIGPPVLKTDRQASESGPPRRPGPWSRTAGLRSRSPGDNTVACGSPDALRGSRITIQLPGTVRQGLVAPRRSTRVNARKGNEDSPALVEHVTYESAPLHREGSDRLTSVGDCLDSLDRPASEGIQAEDCAPKLCQSKPPVTDRADDSRTGFVGSRPVIGAHLFEEASRVSPLVLCRSPQRETPGRRPDTIVNGTDDVALKVGTSPPNIIAGGSVRKEARERPEDSITSAASSTPRAVQSREPPDRGRPPTPTTLPTLRFKGPGTRPSSNPVPRTEAKSRVKEPLPRASEEPSVRRSSRTNAGRSRSPIQVREEAQGCPLSPLCSARAQHSTLAVPSK